VVRVQDRDLGRAPKPDWTHHRDVRPRDRKDPRRPPRRRGDRADAPTLRPAVGHHRVARQGRREGPAPRRRPPAPAPPPRRGAAPPCGMQNVLCRFRCDTSAPNAPGAASPTSAFRFAPSTYTWPPCSWTTAHTSPMPVSNTPWVDGYVAISAPRLSVCALAFC